MDASAHLQCDDTTPNMTSFRRHRLITVLIAMVTLLFTQLAVARYVCPSEMVGGAEYSVVMAHDGMPCATSMPTSMDTGQSGLCQAHCQADQQSAEAYALPVLPVMQAISINFVLQDIITISPGVPHQAPSLQRTTAPPLSVRNCCFRN